MKKEYAIELFQLTLDTYDPTTYDKSKNQVIVIAKEELSLIEFMSRAKVRTNSHAGQLIERTWNYLFGEMLDLRKEYNSFYSREYDSFVVFMEKYYGCYESLLEKIKDLGDKSGYIGVTKFLFGSNFSGFIRHIPDYDSDLSFSEALKITFN